MGNQAELIVEFNKGVSEDDARALAASLGAKVRRRMRTDHEDDVTLLIKVDADQVDTVERSLSAKSSVARTERNLGGYSISS